MGGVEFINFPNASFRSEICSEQLLQLLESGVKSERCNADRCAGAQLKNREISFLTRILGRMTPICISKIKILTLCINDLYRPIIS